MAKRTSTALLYGGIDVHLLLLFVAIIDANEQLLFEGQFPNNRAGHDQLRRKLKSLARKNGGLRLCLEPTSRYHLAIRIALAQEPLIDVRNAPPKGARDFARAGMARGKTDRADARVLARYVLHFDLPCFEAPSKAAFELRAITRRICALVDLRTGEKNRRHAAAAGADPECVLTGIQQHIDELQRQIKWLQAEALKICRRDPELNNIYLKVRSIKGYGERSGLLVTGEIAMFPKGLTKRQWVALAGLDPKPMESGGQCPPRRLSKQGNKYLRRILYMPAMVASQKSTEGQSYYSYMLGHGKAPLQALAAMMRKYLCAIWGMLQSNTLFEPTKFFSQGD